MVAESVTYVIPLNDPKTLNQDIEDISWWLTPRILATQEAEIKRIEIPSQPRQTVQETLSQKNPSQKRAGEVAQGIGSEFKFQHHKNKQKKILRNLHHFQRQSTEKYASFSEPNQGSTK
jgi:hypothetical protein